MAKIVHCSSIRNELRGVHVLVAGGVGDAIVRLYRDVSKYKMVADRLNTSLYIWTVDRTHPFYLRGVLESRMRSVLQLIEEEKRARYGIIINEDDGPIRVIGRYEKTLNSILNLPEIGGDPNHEMFNIRYIEGVLEESIASNFGEHGLRILKQCEAACEDDDRIFKYEIEVPYRTDEERDLLERYKSHSKRVFIHALCGGPRTSCCTPYMFYRLGSMLLNDGWCIAWSGDYFFYREDLKGLHPTNLEDYAHIIGILYTMYELKEQYPDRCLIAIESPSMNLTYGLAKYATWRIAVHSMGVPLISLFKRNNIYVTNTEPLPMGRGYQTHHYLLGEQDYTSSIFIDLHRNKSINRQKQEEIALNLYNAITNRTENAAKRCSKLSRLKLNLNLWKLR